MFAILVVTIIGNGEGTFWYDRWLHGHGLKELAPNILKCVLEDFVRQEQWLQLSMI